jgi:hypothetical protein
MPRQKHIALLILALATVGASAYLLYCRAWVGLAYTGEAPDWFMQVVSTLYPRFEVEKQRFELAFFLDKADQVVIRMSLLLVLSAALLLNGIRPKLLSLLSITKPPAFFEGLRLSFYLGLLYFSWHWYEDIPRLISLAEFYKPTYLLRLLRLPILPAEVFYSFFALYLFSLLMVIGGRREILFSMLSAVLLILFQAYFYSFEKVEHSYATLNYVAMLMPFLFYEISRQPQKALRESYVLFLMRASVAGVYLLAGLEKLLSSGLGWASAETFRTYIALHQQPLGLWIAESDFLSHLLPWLALLIQLGFPLILIVPRYKYVILLAGTGFHLGTRLLFGIGPFFSAWILSYVVFLDWDVLSEQIQDLRGRRQSKAKKGA